MVSAFKPYFSPSVTVLNSEDDLAKFKKSNPVFALALLKVNQINFIRMMSSRNVILAELIIESCGFKD
jgi:hypothetical protein